MVPNTSSLGSTNSLSTPTSPKLPRPIVTIGGAKGSLASPKLERDPPKLIRLRTSNADAEPAEAEEEEAEA